MNRLLLPPRVFDDAEQQCVGRRVCRPRWPVLREWRQSRLSAQTHGLDPASGEQEGARLDNRLVAEPGVQQSVKIEEAAWIGARLSPFDSGVVTSVVPSGFDAYARVLHPLDPPVRDQEPARWGDVASWSGVELVPGIDFPDIALPEQEPTGAEPWPGRVPQVGTLDPADADALAAVLARHTSTPDRCWFCTWEGWGSVFFDDGPRVELPGQITRSSLARSLPCRP